MTSSRSRTPLKSCPKALGRRGCLDFALPELDFKARLVYQRGLLDGEMEGQAGALAGTRDAITCNYTSYTIILYLYIYI